MSVRFQKTPRGEVAILPRKDYELLVAKASEAEEDAGTARIVARAGKEIARGGPLLPKDIADSAEQPVPGAAEHRRAEPDADAMDRTVQQRKSHRGRGDEPGQRIAHGGKQVGSRKQQQDVGARND